MDKETFAPFIPAALFIAIGLALGGWFIGDGFEASRSAGRFVTVKGVSERDVESDLAFWTIAFNAADNSLSAAQQKISQSADTVREFLNKHGIEDSQIELQQFQVTDALANPYQQHGQVANRYVIGQTIIVRSEDPQKIKNASQQVDEIVSAGVVLTSGRQYGNGGPTYLFTRLNDYKPEMIAEATANARTSAEQFAKDSDSELGSIRRANQGVFVVLPRDRVRGMTAEQQISKTIRVVSTIDYFLKD